MRERWCDEELYAGLGVPSSLRILHLCKFFPPERGGMETYVHDLAREQGDAGHQVTVLAHSAVRSGREVLAQGCTLVRNRVWMRAGEYVPVAPALPLALWRALRTVRPHIVHVHCPNPAALWCVPLGGAPSPRLVVHWHSDVIFPEHRQPHPLSLFLWRRMERALLGRAHRIIATSQPYLDSSEFLAPWRDKCVVAPLRLRARSVPVAANVHHAALDFLRGPVGDTTRAVLAVGRLAHYKGFDVLLRALAREPSLRCCIVGEGEEGPNLRALVHECGLQDRVLLAGAVDDAVLSACYEACHVFCLPSILRTEAFGVVLLEALRAHKWCVVSRVAGSGMSTLIDDGKNGRLVEPGHAAALARALCENFAGLHAE